MTPPADEREHVLCDEADGRINELEAEVERLRQALRAIRDHGKSETYPCHAWGERVTEVVDQAHAENWGGKHREGFCEACADAYIVAQHAVPDGPSAPRRAGPADGGRLGGSRQVSVPVSPWAR